MVTHFVYISLIHSQNRLDLPETYDSKQVCKERFQQAVEYGLIGGFHLT